MNLFRFFVSRFLLDHLPNNLPNQGLCSLFLFLATTGAVYGYEFRLSDIERWTEGGTVYVIRDAHGRFLARGRLRVEKWRKHSSGKVFPVATVRDAQGRFLTAPQEGVVHREDHFYVNADNRDCVDRFAVVRDFQGKFVASAKLNDNEICW